MKYRDNNKQSSNTYEWGLLAFLVLLAFLACCATCRCEVLVITSDSCAPCKKMSPDITALSYKYDISRENISYNKDAAKQYGIRVVPTTIVFRDNREVQRYEGYLTRGQLEQLCISSEAPALGRWVIRPVPLACVGVLGVGVSVNQWRWVWVPEGVE